MRNLLLLILFVPYLAYPFDSLELLDKLIVSKESACKDLTSKPKYKNKEVAAIFKYYHDRYCTKIITSMNSELPPDHWSSSLYLTLKADLALEQKSYDQFCKLSIKKAKLQPEQAKAEEQINNAIKVVPKKFTPQLRAYLMQISPRLIKRPKLTNFILVGRDFKKNRNYKKAYKYLKRGWQKLKLTPQENAKVSFEITQISKLIHGSNEYIKQSEKFAKFFTKDKQAYFKHSLNALITHWTRGRKKTALARIEKLIKVYKKQNFAYLLWVKSLILRDLKRTLESNRFLKLSTAYLSKEEDKYFSKIVFDVAQFAYQQGDLELLEKVIKQDLTRLKWERDKQRILYWYARLLGKKNKKKEAQEVFKQLIEINHLGYYALIASARIQQVPKVVVDEFKVDKLPKELWFLRLSSDEVSDHYLKHLKDFKQELSNALVLVKEMHAQGKHYESFNFLYEYPQEELLPVLKKYPKIFYPQVHLEYLESSPIDKYLALGIIKKESLYNPKAQSVANALGLMQVLPSVGRQIIRKMKKSKQLFNPKTNIYVGTRYFKKLLKRFDNNIILSLAAYNAGPHRVRKWRRKKIFRGPWDENIERIPYPETRNYVKRVLRNYWNYKRIYTKDFTLAELKFFVK